MSLYKIIKFSLIAIAILSSVNFGQTEPIKNENVQSSDSVFVMTKSPWGAVLRSAVLPGWGQYYNESYWKIPVVLGATGYFIYGWIQSNTFYVDNKNLYESALLNSSNLTSAYKSRRDFYRDQRDMFAFYIGITYFLSMVDAYVDAEMFDFTVAEDNFTFTPTINIKYYF